ncbi:D-Ala-D-Ala carboxypeptidase family metallohydrolase [Massilibacteroides sp.]|uniref:D-Ala-D-Ala carboxypeptidase family metallohydrolase n=1 Tax=Massilibacteroides sp. TaxID=2034766 RepID=UPI00263328C9|nr:D-Ala-D-Ala carboxypeptidase family metallohydrolase [Massilibacteroides sp.]MDD4515624.1 D-Ala-D-Ala carboxypeptidase family metallohydrolase [Massilibacteroides sp.]
MKTKQLPIPARKILTQIINEMKISDHISLAEATKSITAQRLGIDNTPDDKTIDRMKLVANHIFEPLRNYFGVPIKIESFYRCETLNKVIGGAVGSQHLIGEAMDIDDDFGEISNRQIFVYIAQYLEFDQLIWEFGNDNSPDWVHASYSTNNRHKLSVAYKKNGYTKYEHFTSLESLYMFLDDLYN